MHRISTRKIEEVRAGGEDALLEMIANEIKDDLAFFDPDALKAHRSQGGWPDLECDIEFSYEAGSVEGEIALISFEVYFTEQYSSGCGDHPHSEPATGEIEYKVDLESGQVTAVRPFRDEW